ncbi:acyl-CoA dehydrogenase, partial [Pseudomonas aeruginosa]|nr:acyl-CoA dehydrogenase [Pseudomonas aeruginosa]
GLSLGAMNTLMQHGTEEQKQTYLVPLTEGRWGGTMCLTEPQCGTDLGQVKTRAEGEAGIHGERPVGCAHHLLLERAEAHRQALATVLHRVREALPAAGDIGLV